MSRLPQQVSLLGKKFGAMSGPSPAKNNMVKPGAALVRKPPQLPSTSHDQSSASKQQRKPLHRVATETSATKLSKTPSLVRVASDSAALPGLKRERSETPSIFSFPLADAAS